MSRIVVNGRRGFRPSRLITPALLAFVLMAHPRLSPGQPAMVAEASPDSSDHLIGDRIDVEVRITHPEGATFQPLTGDTLGPFQVLRQEPFRRISSGESATRIEVALYDTGHVALPPIRFLGSLPRDTTRYVVETQPVRLAIHPVPLDKAGDIRDIAPPIRLGYTWVEIVWPAGLLLLVPVAVWGGYRYRSRRKKAGLPEARPIDLRPPHIVALERLRAIEAEQLWQKGKVKEYHSEVAEAVRAYLDGRYGLRALELTTHEILVRLGGIDLPEGVREDLRAILDLADLVKFARYRALPEENEETLAKAFSAVERTAERVAPSGGPAVSGVAEHVPV